MADSLTQAFIQYIGGGTAPIGSVSYSYVGKDATGQVYRFSYTVGGIVRNVTFSVFRDPTGYTFSRPVWPSGDEEDIPSLDDVQPIVDTEMALAKERARGIFTEMLAAGQLDTFGYNRWISWVNSFSGQPEHLLDEAFRLQTLEPVRGNLGPPEGEGGEPEFDLTGSRGAGFAGPVYRAPDRRVVEDFVKGGLVSLVGQLFDVTRINDLVNLYLRDHRRNFDSIDTEIDPSQSVIRAIRQSAEYKTIHQNRPDTEDERTWISDRLSAAAQGGLTVGQQQDFAIAQATAAGDLGDVREAAAFTQLSRSGQAPTFLNNLVRGVASNMFRGVRI